MPTIPLIDDRLIAQTFALRREVCRPAAAQEEPILTEASAYGSLLRDESGQWRMWYLGGPGYCEYVATSDDGLNWRRPRLDLVCDEIRAGLVGPNAFMSHNQRDADGRWLAEVKGPEGFCVLDAESTPHPAAKARFTALYLARFGPPESRVNGMCIAHSDDGIHWRADPSNPVIPGWLDTNNNFFWDCRTRQYVMYGRPNAHVAAATQANRLIARYESADVRNWSPARVVLDTDERDAPAFDLLDESALRSGGGVADAQQRAAFWERVTEGAVQGKDAPTLRGRNRQWYAMTAFPYADLYLGLGLMYDLPSGHLWIELLHSVDGLDWRREPLREPFIDRREDGFMAVPFGSPPVMVGDEMRLYHGVRNVNHHGQLAPGCDRRRTWIELRTLPRDRWVAYRAGGREGELLTHVMPRPEALSLNAATEPDGAIRVEITDELGQPLEGFTLADCAPLTGDGLQLEPRWNARAIDAAPHDLIRLRVTARNASLYALNL